MLLAVCQSQGIESDQVPRIATAFGGGMGGSGGTCGALTGALMAVSLKLGRNNSDEDRRRAYGAAQRMYASFTEAMGAADCAELTGLDLRTHEGSEKLRESGLREKVCLPAVSMAAGLAEAELERDADDGE